LGRTGVRPAAIQPMSPALEAKTRFSDGAPQWAIAAEKPAQSRASMYSMEPKYAEVPGSAHTLRMAKALVGLVFMTGPWRVKRRSTSRGGAPLTGMVSWTTRIASQRPLYLYWRGFLGLRS